MRLRSLVSNGLMLTVLIALGAMLSALVAPPEEGESLVWHHRPDNKVGQVVLDLHGEPGIGGWLPFIHSAHIMEEVDGVWSVRTDVLPVKIQQKAEEIEASGYCMLDVEKPLGEYENIPLYIQAIELARDTLNEMGLFDIKLGFYRIIDHKESQRHVQVPVLRHSDAVFIVTKGTAENWSKYFRDVVQVSGHLDAVIYLDAFDRNTGQPFPQEEILARVRLAYGYFENPQFAFRQQGTHVATAMVWVRNWLND